MCRAHLLNLIYYFFYNCGSANYLLCILYNTGQQNLIFFSAQIHM